MSSLDLKDETVARIRRVLELCPGVSSAAVFGSRAMGRAKPSSDIDIALFGTLDLHDLGRIRAELEELSIPQKCDVEIYDHIQSEALRRHIDTWDKVFYTTAAQDTSIRC